MYPFTPLPAKMWMGRAAGMQFLKEFDMFKKEIPILTMSKIIGAVPIRGIVF